MTSQKGKAKQVVLEDACAKCFEFWNKSVSSWVTRLKFCDLCRASKDFSKRSMLASCISMGRKRRTLWAQKWHHVPNMGLRFPPMAFYWTEKTLASSMEVGVLRISNSRWQASQTPLARPANATLPRTLPSPTGRGRLLTSTMMVSPSPSLIYNERATTSRPKISSWSRHCLKPDVMELCRASSRTSVASTLETYWLWRSCKR